MCRFIKGKEKCIATKLSDVEHKAKFRKLKMGTHQDNILSS